MGSRPKLSWTPSRKRSLEKLRPEWPSPNRAPTPTPGNRISTFIPRTRVAEKTYREAIVEAMAEEMRRDERVVLIGEDVGKFGGAMGASKGLFQEFGPDRVIDTPISEAAIVGSALGMALTGQRPI